MQSWDKIDDAPEGDFRIFEVLRRRARSPRSGEAHDFFVLDAPDWVNVVPVTPGGEVVCIRQYRPGTQTVTLEVPGGMVDPGETPAEAARRELLEETGYVAERLVPLGAVDPNPAIQTNACHTFLAAGATQERPPAPEGAEELVTEHIALAETSALVASGRIRHALVVVAFYLLNQYVEAHSAEALLGPGGPPEQARDAAPER